MSHYYGWKKQQPDHRDFKFQVPNLIAMSLPASMDLFGPVSWMDDQGQLGSCGPNAADSLLRFDELKQGLNPGTSTSRLLVYYNTRAIMGTVSQDSGVDNRSMLQALNKYGYCAESLWPYDIAKFTDTPPKSAQDTASQNLITSYAAVQQTLDDCRGCLAAGFPFLFGFTVYGSFESSTVASTGVVPMPGKREAVLGGHDMVIYGYDDVTQRFKFQNSWGAGWGKSGRGTIPYAYVLNPNLAGDYWVINAVPGVIPVPPAPELPLLKVFYDTTAYSGVLIK